MKQDTKNLSPLGIMVDKFKKAAKQYDKDVTSGIEYEMLKLVEADKKKRELFDLKIAMAKGVRELQAQYQALFNDYAIATGKFKDEEYPFDAVLKNPESAYNKMTALLKQFNNTY